MIPPMSRITIPLPPRVFEDQLPHLLRSLAVGDGHEEVSIDISEVKFLTPAAIVAVLARCHGWMARGGRIFLRGAHECENLRYLQRIDFLRHLGIDMEEDFHRHPTADRFVPIQALTFARGNVDVISSEITRCVLPNSEPSDDVYGMMQYATGELLSNAKYHSGGKAFVCAQVFPQRNLVRIAVADDGQGIRGSFVNTTREADAATPDDAIRLALQPGVSSANLRPVPQPYGGRSHRGVGLTITRILAAQALGELTISTESGWFRERHGQELPPQSPGVSFPGTLVAVSLHRDHIADYAAMHATAMAEIGMGPLDTGGIFGD